MFLERSEFFSCSNINSPFIYVYGGTIKKEERGIIERYDTKEDAW